MAGDGDIDIELNLDAENFKASLEGATGLLRKLGAGGEMTEIVENLVRMTAAAGGVYAAYKLISEIVDATFETEKVQQLNAQFEMLTKNAGLSGEELKNGLTKAAGGLVTDTELIQAANKALVEMGGSASKLPEIMEIARKATKVFGGDLIQNFEAMNQAVATGNTRLLRHFGIVIDATKTVRDYAVAHNIATNEITQHGRSQAVLEALLEKGNDVFGEQTETVTTAHTEFKKLTVAFKEFVEVIQAAISQSEVLRGLFIRVREGISSLTDTLKEHQGGAEGAAAGVDKLKTELEHMNRIVEENEKSGGNMALFDAGLVDNAKRRIVEINAELAKANANLELQKALDDEIKRKKGTQERETGVSKPGVPTEAEPEIDYEQRKRNNAKFQEELVKLRTERNQAEMKNIEDLDAFEKLHEEQKVMARQETDAKIAAIEANDTLRKEQKVQLEAQIRQIGNQKLIALDQNMDVQREQILNRYVQNSTNAADGIARAFSAGSKKSALELQNWGKAGDRIFTSFGNHATSALQAWGAGTKTASEAAKGFIMGMLADEAEARGKLILLASIWPPNPAGLAAGAGLIALSGFLRSQAGGAGSGVGGGGGADVGGAAAPQTGPNPGVQANAAPQKQVTIEVQGHYFETEQTQTRLMDMIRSATDGTDFRYVQIGQK